MASIIRALIKEYKWFNNDLSDPRTSEWPLLDSPWNIAVIIATYLYFVHKAGPSFMEYRKPFQLDRIIQIFNALQVLMCSYLTIQTARAAFWESGYSFTCEPVDYSSSPTSVRIATYAYWYFCIKIIDLMDTVFFILRKKTSQVTFLHVYHHAGMVVTGYVAAKYIPGGQGVYVGLFNSFVHAIMYSYYFITNYNPEYKKKIWWKKYITQLQMVQFLLIIVFLGLTLFQPDCKYPRIPVTLFIPQNVFMLFLFWDFYKRAYRQPKKMEVKS